jgi:hypothetical protein
MKGQALITLLFFMIIGLMVTSAAVVLMYVNAISGSRQQDGEIAYQAALSGAENAKIRVLRNPSYTGESNLQIGSGSATIAVSGTGTSVDPYVITSTGTRGNFVRKVQIQASYVNNFFSVLSEKEIF